MTSPTAIPPETPRFTAEELLMEAAAHGSLAVVEAGVGRLDDSQKSRRTAAMLRFAASLVNAASVPAPCGECERLKAEVGRITAANDCRMLVFNDMAAKLARVAALPERWEKHAESLLEQYDRRVKQDIDDPQLLEKALVKRKCADELAVALAPASPATTKKIGESMGLSGNLHVVPATTETEK